MIRVKEAILVEGRYDKNTLSQVVDALIIESSGFGVFNDRELISLLRRLAERQGLIILTDSDGAGFLIRGKLKGMLPEGVKHAYIPDVYGKEKRKRTASAEGKLGVEGMSPEVLAGALRQAGAVIDGEEDGSARPLTAAEFFALGLSGMAGSAARRDALKRRLGLPQKLPSKALRELLPRLLERDALERLVRELEAG